MEGCRAYVRRHLAGLVTAETCVKVGLHSPFKVVSKINLVLGRGLFLSIGDSAVTLWVGLTRAARQNKKQALVQHSALLRQIMNCMGPSLNGRMSSSQIYRNEMLGLSSKRGVQER